MEINSTSGVSVKNSCNSTKITAAKIAVQAKYRGMLTGISADTLPVCPLTVA